MRIWNQLWNDDCGQTVSSELVLMATLIALGLLAGLTAVRDGVVSEISDVAGSVQDLNQSYSFRSLQGHSATTVGSDGRDAVDFCDDADAVRGLADNCIRMNVLPANESVEPVNAVNGQIQRRGRRAALQRFGNDTTSQDDL